MASYNYTFLSGDTITPTRLNDARTVSDIVNADIKSDAAIAGTKLAAGAITNTQVSDTAAIAGTKIAPAFGGQDITFSTANRSITNTGNFALSFGTNNTERMRIAASGDVGIGTTSPSGKLHVNNGRTFLVSESGDGYVLNLRSAGLTDGCWITNPTENNFGVASQDGTERMRIDASGNVGIGNTSPAFKLDVTGDINTSEGFAVDGVVVVNNRRTGWTAPTGTATRTTFATSTVTTAQLAERVKALIDDLTSHGLIGA